MAVRSIGLLHGVRWRRMRALRLVLVVCLIAVPAVALAPPAQATDCVTAPPVCPVGSVPWPKRTSSSCGAHGVAWTCAWLW